MAKKILLIVGLIALVATSSFVTTLVQGSEDIDPVLVQDIIDKAIPIIMGVITGLVTSLMKSRTLEGIFTNMATEGKDIFVKASSNVSTVTKESIETRKEVKELTREIAAIRKELAEVKEIKTTIDIMNERQKIAYLNDPELVKNGVAKLIAKVGVKDET